MEIHKFSWYVAHGIPLANAAFENQSRDHIKDKIKIVDQKIFHFNDAKIDVCPFRLISINND